MSKRQKFLTTSIILSLGFVVANYFELLGRFVSIGFLGFLTLVFFFWSLKEGLGKNMTLTVLILPFLFTISVGLFWFLIPANLFARIPVIVVYGVGIYTLCLTANIYTVSAIRTIALQRAARGVGFVLTLFTMFLIYDALLSIRTNVVITSVSVAFASLPLFFQGFWSINLRKDFSLPVLILSLISALVIGEVALGLHFWPVTVVVGSLFLTVTSYVLLGLGQVRLEGRLFQQTIREHLTLGVLVFLGMLVATRWAG